MGRSKVERTKNRKEGGSFVMLPHYVITHPNFHRLTAYEVKLFIDLCGQYFMSNNGDFTATYSVMNKKGWRSKDTLNRALKGLIESGFIVVTRQGGRNRCSLYGLTFKPIDECGGKLDIKPTKVALGWWKTGVQANDS